MVELRTVVGIKPDIKLRTVLDRELDFKVGLGSSLGTNIVERLGLEFDLELEAVHLTILGTELGSTLISVLGSTIEYVKLYICRSDLPTLGDKLGSKLGKLRVDNKLGSKLGKLRGESFVKSLGSELGTAPG